eukprot:scaffold18347_cov128-Isochrysis_galbana.AAC.4
METAEWRTMADDPGATKKGCWLRLSMAGLLLSRMLNSVSVHHWHQDHLAAVVSSESGQKVTLKARGLLNMAESREQRCQMPAASRRSRREGTESAGVERAPPCETSERSISCLRYSGRGGERHLTQSILMLQGCAHSCRGTRLIISGRGVRPGSGVGGVASSTPRVKFLFAYKTTHPSS